MKKIAFLIIALLLLTGCSNLPKSVFKVISPHKNTTTAATTTTATTTVTTTTSTSVTTTQKPVSQEVTAKIYGAVTFKTPIKDYNRNRLNNIKLACKQLDGDVIKPGEMFSFNGFVGPRTAEKGYKEAIIFYDGKKVQEIGGGICQVSSTIYNTALKAKFKINEVHRHGLPVNYVAAGKDATVYYGYKDLRFTNTSGKSVKIKAYCDGKIVSVSFYPV